MFPIYVISANQMQCLKFDLENEVIHQNKNVTFAI